MRPIFFFQFIIIIFILKSSYYLDAFYHAELWTWLLLKFKRPTTTKYNGLVQLAYYKYYYKY